MTFSYTCIIVGGLYPFLFWPLLCVNIDVKRRYCSLFYFFFQTVDDTFQQVMPAVEIQRALGGRNLISRQSLHNTFDSDS